MEIKKKFFYVFSCSILILTLLSYTTIYVLYTKAFQDKIMNYQKTAVSMNQTLTRNFMDLIRNSALQLIGNEAMGKYLNYSDSDDILTSLNTRNAIIHQFSHYSTPQILESNYHLKNTLFLNDKLPITSGFSAYTLETNPYYSSSNVFSNTQIKNSVWYQNMIRSGSSISVFLNEASGEFCFAQVIRNNYYTGPYFPEGEAVMVVSTDTQNLEELFSFEPISEHSGYAFFEQSGELLFLNGESEKQLYLKAHEMMKNSRQKSGSVITIDGERYVASMDTTDKYKMDILFLTPYSDIDAELYTLMKKYFLIVAVMSLSLMIGIYLISDRFTRPIIRLADIIGSIDDTRNFNPDSLRFIKEKELRVLCGSFSQLAASNNRMIEDIQAHSEQQKRSELRALQAQINPHFIFNAMDIVNWMALSKNEDEIASIVSSIAELMRYSITDPDQLVDIRQELGNILEYIKIQQLRYSKSITFSAHLGSEPVGIFIPKFTIQPLVENCVCHGLTDDMESLHIELHIFRDKDATVIEIEDDGCGCNADELNRFLLYDDASTLEVSNGFGIRNVNERLHLNFPEGSRLCYETSRHGHLTARIILIHRDKANA